MTIMANSTSHNALPSGNSVIQSPDSLVNWNGSRASYNRQTPVDDPDRYSVNICLLFTFSTTEMQGLAGHILL